MALRLIACTVAASAAVGTLAGAGFTIGTADALHSAPLFLPDIPNCEADNQCNNRNYDDVIHKTAPFGNHFFSAYSAARDLLVLLIKVTITATMAATTIRPGRKPAPKEPVVTRVPT